MINANYSQVNESLARQAWNGIHMRGYDNGKATSEQNYYTNAIVEYANDLIQKHNATEEQIATVQNICDRYSAKIAALINEQNSIDAMCPSVFVTGTANFPVARKEKQNARNCAFWQKNASLFETSSNNYYFKKIYNLLSNKIIYSDDKNAIEKIKAKIEMLKGQPDPYGNKSAEIRRLKERLLQLAPDEMKANKKITINGIEASYQNIIELFNTFKPEKSVYGNDNCFYLSVSLVFSDGSRKYNAYISEEVNEDCSQVRRYGNAENGYKSYFAPLTDKAKFNLIISKINGSGNKAVIYSILKDLIPQQPESEQQKTELSTANGVKLEEDTAQMRIKLLFNDIPDAQTRTLLKANGFRWSPSNKAWQRLLNDNGRYAAKKVLKKLAE